MPNMDKIDFMYHFFSYADLVQPVLGLFGREYPSHERIANIRTLINDKNPLHSQLHNPLVAKWICMFHHDLQITNDDSEPFKVSGGPM